MAKATASDNTELLTSLDELATVIRNSEQGYKHSAESVQDSDLRSTFSDLARERERQGDELDEIIRSLGGTPPSREGSTAGAAHRMWVDLKAAVTGGSRLSVLQEVYRGESYAEECYDRVLKSGLRGMTVGQDAMQKLQRQHSSVKAARDRFRSMIEAEGGSVQMAGRMGGIAGGVEHYVVERPMMGTALALGVGLILGCLLTMSMRTMSSGGGGGRMQYGGRQTGRRYGSEGRTGYGGYGTSGYGYGTSGQTGYGAGTQRYYGEGGGTSGTTSGTSGTTSRS